MKTLKTVVNQDEKVAKIVGLVINSLLTVAGLATCLYGIVIWAQHNNLF